MKGRVRVAAESDVLVVGSAPVAGCEAFYAETILSARKVVAADGGVALCRMAGRVPDVCVGDFDSVREEDLSWAIDQGAACARFPAAKDVSDLDLAVAQARALGARSIDMTAAFSGRLDHTMASLGTLLSTADVRGRGTEPGETLYALSASSESVLTLCASAGGEFSVYAVSGPAVVSIEGARYPLLSAEIPSLSSLGLNNVVDREAVRVTVEAGEVLVIARQPVVGVFGVKSPAD